MSGYSRRSRSARRCRRTRNSSHRCHPVWRYRVSNPEPRQGWLRVARHISGQTQAKRRRGRMPLKLPIGIFFLGEVGGSEAEPWTREVRLDPRTPSTMMKGQLDRRERGREGRVMKKRIASYLAGCIAHRTAALAAGTRNASRRPVLLLHRPGTETISSKRLAGKLCRDSGMLTSS